MKLEVQTISLSIKPSNEPRNAFQRVTDTLALYGWLAMNTITLIRLTRHSLKTFNESVAVVSLQCKISQPARKVTNLTALESNKAGDTSND